MTLATRAHIAKPVDAEQLFLHLLGILERDPDFTPAWNKPDSDPIWRVDPGPLSHGRATYEHRRKGDPVYQRGTGNYLWDTEENHYRSTTGQGLASSLHVTYGADGPLNWPGAEYEDGAMPDDTVERMPLHLVSVNLDTAYGYRSINGAGCSDVHAYLLREMGLWLDDCGVTEWIWHDEYRRTWHGPGELARLGNAGLAALQFSEAG